MPEKTVTDVWNEMSEAAYIADTDDIPPGSEPTRVMQEAAFYRGVRVATRVVCAAAAEKAVAEAVEEERKRIRERLGL